MSEMILEWEERGQVKKQIISDRQTSKIGRDPDQCDVVVGSEDRTVSRLHIEIFFNAQDGNFYIKNLKGKTNAVQVNNQILTQGEVPLKKGSLIRLGVTEIKITDITTGVPATIIGSFPVQPAAPNVQTPAVKQPVASGQMSPTRGIKCPACGAIANYNLRSSFCNQCGRMLADAESVLQYPHNH